jgi:hypothetical protein
VKPVWLPSAFLQLPCLHNAQDDIKERPNH